jgi:hypothetical protein
MSGRHVYVFFLFCICYYSSFFFIVHCVKSEFLFYAVGGVSDRKVENRKSSPRVLRVYIFFGALQQIFNGWHFREHSLHSFASVAFLFSTFFLRLSIIITLVIIQ